LEKASTSKWVESFLKDLKIAYRPRSMYYLGEGALMNEGLDAKAIVQRADVRKLNIQLACD